MNLRWSSPEAFPILGENEVHVWCVSLNYSADQLSHFFALLSPDEQVRGQRFHFEKDQNQFIATHGILRELLGYYLKKNPQTLKFCLGPYGKPSLENHRALEFNLSHSHNIALVAFAYHIPIGIDIEYMEPARDLVAIAERFFSPNEFKTIQTLNAEKQVQAFYNAWTRKEAFLKALGEGLSYPLKNVEVSVLPEDPAQILAFHDQNQNVSQWQLHALDPCPHYAAALVYKGLIHDIKIWQRPIE